MVHGVLHPKTHTQQATAPALQLGLWSVRYFLPLVTAILRTNTGPGDTSITHLTSHMHMRFNTEF